MAHIALPDLLTLPTYASTSTSRLHSLYADISRQKHSNPSSFQSTVLWWNTTLHAILAKGWQPRSQDKLVLHADHTILPEAFRYEGVGRPLCLATVVVSTN
jgi:charged multivesicular body protein 7